jgi:aspartyl-tRNA(Asn)/glutamyl-tRNA(Gln) amidotransferase subunit A
MLDAMVESPVEKSPVHHPIRIGVVRQFFYDKAGGDARAATDHVVDELSKAGFHVEEIGLPAIFAAAQAALRVIVRSEAASNHHDLFKRHSSTYGKKIRALVETGMLLDAATYVRARRIWRKYQHEMASLLAHVDAALTPAAVGAAPDLSSTGDPVMNSPWTLADVPIVTLPCALAGNGLPLAVQLSAAPLCEGSLLDVAKAVERVVDFRVRPNL